jgi:hypothetical protein
MKRYRVVVIEWLSHKAYIEAESAEDAEKKSRELWENKAEADVFVFEDSGIEGITVEEITE